jgi:signal transduction histidine kinase
MNADSHDVIFEIRNSGCDLSPNEVDRVFKRFWKHDAARTEVPEHCGLGLPLCRRIVEALGGSINAALDNRWFAVKIGLPLGMNGEA